MSFDESSAKESMAVASGGLSRDRNYTERLSDEIRSLTARLARKQRLKELLDKNPVIREALELMN